MSEKALEMQNVSVVRGGKHILEHITLSIDDGENVAIIGLNGSGKTTLLKLLRGDAYPYYDPEAISEMRIFGDEHWNVFDIRSKMGVVSMDLQDQFQSDTQVYEVIASGFFGSLDVYRNMEVSDRMMEEVHMRAVQMGIEDLLERTIEGLSLGEMRRALIARALVTNPRMLVLDEPMTGLDIVMKSKFRQMFDILINNGVSIIMITHDLTDIPISVQRIVMLRDGQIFADGSKMDLLKSATVSELYGEPIKVECSKGIYRMYLE